MSCRECKEECIGDTPCIRCRKMKNVEILMPGWIVAGLITLLIYFMWR